jgi:hypothetical protein
MIANLVRKRWWVWLLVLVVLAVPGCGDETLKKTEPSQRIDADGERAAVEYGRATFVEHDCGKAAKYHLFGEEADYCRRYRHHNLRLSQERLSRDCRQKSGTIADCVDLRFVGRTRTVALRLWMTETDDGWRILEYEVSAG